MAIKFEDIRAEAPKNASQASERPAITPEPGRQPPAPITGVADKPKRKSR